jgi:hypothetical protein
MLRRLKLLIILAGLSGATACGVAPDEPSPTESPLGWIGTATMEGDYYCANGSAWHIVQPVTQSYTRPIVGTNYYTVSLNGNGLPTAQDPRNRVALSCSSYKVPAAPVGASGELWSTGASICSVFYRWGNVRDWNYAGYVQASLLRYAPNYSTRGNYLLSVPSAVFAGSGDGVPINGCAGVAGQVWFSFGA